MKIKYKYILSVMSDIYRGYRSYKTGAINTDTSSKMYTDITEVKLAVLY